MNTGEETLKGGRIKRVEKYIESDLFHLSYGDGVCDINLNNLVDFHNTHGCIGSVTAVRPPSRFGELNINEDNTVINLEEKPQMGRGLINGGFFIFSNKMLSYLTEDENCDELQLYSHVTEYTSLYYNLAKRKNNQFMILLTQI